MLSATPISFASAGAITDTGIDLAGLDVYELRADLTPTPLAAGTRYWFSVLADTSNDANDDFFWVSGNLGSDFAAFRNNLNNSGPFMPSSRSPFHFILDNAAVPEPAGLAIIGLGAMALRRRR